MSDVGIGAVLREARTEQGRGVSEAAAATSMRVAQIEAIEDDRFHEFGGDVYAKGFLKTYALWLGLDPEPLLDRYRRYVQHDSMDPLALTAGPVTRERRPELPSWLLSGVALVGVIALGLGIVSLVQSRVPDPYDQQEVALPPAAVETPTETIPSPTPSPEPSPSPTFEGVELTLAFEAASWVSVTVDGERRQERVFEAGDVLDLQGDQTIEVRIGNAGGVVAVYNGRNVGPFGENGAVLDVIFTTHDFQVVA